MKPSDPILLFDSGVGGLSVLAQLRKTLPDAPVIYAADFAAMPYGGKSEAEIAARVPALLGRMVERFRPRLVTIACNTASTIALAAVRSALDVPVVGTVPAIKPAASLTKTGTIGLLGTAATIRQSYVDDLEREFAGGNKLLRHAAPELVAAAEAKLRGETLPEGAIESAVAGLRSQTGGEDIDIVVLACTHFPLLVSELADQFSGAVRFVDGAEGIARRIAYLTQGNVFQRQSNDFLVTTGDVASLANLMPALEKYGLAEIRAL